MSKTENQHWVLELASRVIPSLLMAVITFAAFQISGKVNDTADLVKDALIQQAIYGEQILAVQKQTDRNAISIAQNALELISRTKDRFDKNDAKKLEDDLRAVIRDHEERLRQLEKIKR